LAIVALSELKDVSERKRDRIGRQATGESCRPVKRRLERLTPREREVLEFVVSGRHNREIATDLGISPRTVEVYKARLMQKLQVDRLPDLIRIALDLDLPARER
jgi:RNA polymerase sigma factor (sigma-70 family)